MFSLFSSCSNYCKTVIPPEQIQIQTDIFEMPQSRSEHMHLPYKKYTTRCTFGCVKPSSKKSLKD